MAAEGSHALAMLTSHLRCVACGDVCGSAFQCTQSHSLCFACVEYASGCPLCGSSRGWFQNRSLRHLGEALSFSNACPFCGEVVPIDHIDAHRRSCRLQTFYCPHEDCSFAATGRELTQHMTSYHHERALGRGQKSTLYGAGCTLAHAFVVDDRLVLLRVGCVRTRLAQDAHFEIRIGTLAPCATDEPLSVRLEHCDPLSQGQKQWCKHTVGFVRSGAHMSGCFWPKIYRTVGAERPLQMMDGEWAPCAQSLGTPPSFAEGDHPVLLLRVTFD